MSDSDNTECLVGEKVSSEPPETSSQPLDATSSSQAGASHPSAGGDDTASNGGSSTASGYVPPLLPYDVRRPPFELIMRLQQERSSILAEVSHESQERDWLRQQVDAIERRVKEEKRRQPPHSPGIVIGQLESEAERVTHSMRTRFGSDSEVEERRQTKLRRIHDLDLAMLRLQQASSEDLSSSPHPPPIPPKPSTAASLHHSTDRERAEGSETLDAEEIDKEETQSKEEVKSVVSLVTTATQTSPADLALDLTLPDILLRDSTFPHSPPSPFHEDMTSGDLSEPNVSSAGQTCKLEVVYSLLSMLGTHDTEDLSRTLLAMTSSTDSCHAMRQSGCLPLLIQLLHGSCDPSAPGARGSKAARRRASQALRNLVSSNPDERAGRRELRVLRLLEQLREYCDLHSELDDEEGSISSSSPSPSPPPVDPKPGSAVAALMKLSFNADHQSAICALGGVQAIAELMCVEESTVTTRRYACMALTNLTFGDGANKALLCSLGRPLRALVRQLSCENEDLQQVAASVLRNLSWRADLSSKRSLREVSAPESLMRAAMRCSKETTLKSVLSALWNLSAHCTENKADICQVDGALRFLVSTLSYKSPSKSLAVIENGGGILRNTSSVIALRDDYRNSLRSANCLPILLRHLRSPSLTVVSNACGTLWNLSASCPRDQQLLWELGAVPMLRSLVHSKHKMISMGSASALKNLLSARPNLTVAEERRKKEETTTDGSSPSSNSTSRAASTASAPCGEGVPRSCSKDSVHSDQTHDRLRHVMGNLVPAFPTVLPFTLANPMTLSAHYNSLGHSELTLQHCLTGPSEEAKAVAGEWQSVTRGIEELQLASAAFQSSPAHQGTTAGVPPATHRLSTATNEDQEPLTFCTEGTPYGVSTAASVSDLLQVEHGTGGQSQQMCAAMPPPPPPPRPHHLPPSCVDLNLVRSPSGGRNRFARHRASVTSADGNESDANSEKPQDFGSRFGEGSAPTATTAAGLPIISPRTYAVEDTPVTGGMSRCSSLSSISELDEAAAGIASTTSPTQPAVDSKTKGSSSASSPPTTAATSGNSPLEHPAHHLERIEERASSEAREAAATVHKKSVKFVMSCESGVPVLSPSFDPPPPPPHPPHHHHHHHHHSPHHQQQLAEETPLMFSRSSSLSSLGSSLGERSLHSSVVSEYSRSRNSEVVSPSDLPDSPTNPSGPLPIDEAKASTTSPPHECADDEKHDDVDDDEGDLLSQVIESALPTTLSIRRPVECPTQVIDAALPTTLSIRRPVECPTQVIDAALPTAMNVRRPVECPAQVIDAALPTAMNVRRPVDCSSQVIEPTPRIPPFIDGGSQVIEAGSHVVKPTPKRLPFLEAGSQVVKPTPKRLPLLQESSQAIEPTPRIPLLEGGAQAVESTSARLPLLDEGPQTVEPTATRMPFLEGGPQALEPTSARLRAEGNAHSSSRLGPLPDPSPQPPGRLRGADCLTLYATEDTPQGFSTMASSLSDLTVDSRPPPSIPSSRRPPSSGRSSAGRQRPSISEAPVVYATEGTPALYSYTSPLSSLFMSPVSTGGTASPVPLPKPEPEPKSAEKTEKSGAVSEDRSSLSSLSLDSAGLDRSLLEECISSALPKMPARPMHRQSGVGAARPSRSSTMPSIPTTRLSRLPQMSAFVPVTGTAGRLSRKEAASKTQGRHQSVGQPECPVSVTRSRSAGATLPNSRVDMKAAVATSIANQVAQAAAADQFWGSAPISPTVQVKAARKPRMHKSKSANDEHGVSTRRRSSSNNAPVAAALVDGAAAHLKPAGWRNTSFSKKKKRQKAETPPPPPDNANTGNFLADGSDGDRPSGENNSRRPQAVIRAVPAPRRSSVDVGGAFSSRRGVVGGTSSKMTHQKCLTLPIIGSGQSLIPYADIAVRGRRRRKEEEEAMEEGGSSICEVTYSLSTPSSETTLMNNSDSEGFSPQLWADLEAEMKETSLEIDAATYHRFSDTDNDVDSLSGEEGLDAFSSSSSSPSPPPPVRRARIVKPNVEAIVQPPLPPILPGGRRQRSATAVKRPAAPPPSTPVRLTKAVAQRIGAAGRTFSAPAGTGRGRGRGEMNNNVPRRESLPGRGRATAEQVRNSSAPASVSKTSCSNSPVKTSGLNSPVKTSGLNSPVKTSGLNSPVKTSGPNSPGKASVPTKAVSKPSSNGSPSSSGVKPSSAVKPSPKSPSARLAVNKPASGNGRSSFTSPAGKPSSAASPEKVNGSGRGRKPAAISSTPSTPRLPRQRTQTASPLPVKSVRGRGRGQSTDVTPRRRIGSGEDDHRRVDRSTRIIEASDVLTAAPVYSDESAAGGTPPRPSSSNLSPRKEAQETEKPSRRVTPVYRTSLEPEAKEKVKVGGRTARVLPSL